MQTLVCEEVADARDGRPSPQQHVCSIRVKQTNLADVVVGPGRVTGHDFGPRTIIDTGQVGIEKHVGEDEQPVRGCGQFRLIKQSHVCVLPMESRAVIVWIVSVNEVCSVTVDHSAKAVTKEVNRHAVGGTKSGEKRGSKRLALAKGSSSGCVGSRSIRVRGPVPRHNVGALAEALIKERVSHFFRPVAGAAFQPCVSTMVDLPGYHQATTGKNHQLRTARGARSANHVGGRWLCRRCC